MKESTSKWRRVILVFYTKIELELDLSINQNDQMFQYNFDLISASDDESVSSKSDGAASIRSKRNPEQSSDAEGMTQNVFICTAR